MTPQKLQIGQYSLFLEETNSTNDALRLWFEREKIPEGAVVYTNFQTAGRGQQAAKWESEPGKNVLLSVLFQPNFLLADEQVWLNICISLSVQQALEEITALPVFIKWPNDIFINHQKVAGILIENVLQGSRIKYSIVGIGININQQLHLHPQASSVNLLCNKTTDLNVARSILYKHLENNYSLLKQKQWSNLWDAYHNCLYAKGIMANFETEQGIFAGEIMGIDKKGRLHLLVEEEVKSFANKEIRLLGIINS